jgi:hypothetical protein
MRLIGNPDWRTPALGPLDSRPDFRSAENDKPRRFPRETAYLSRQFLARRRNGAALGPSAGLERAQFCERSNVFNRLGAIFCNSGAFLPVRPTSRRCRPVLQVPLGGWRRFGSRIASFQSLAAPFGADSSAACSCETRELRFAPGIIPAKGDKARAPDWALLKTSRMGGRSEPIPVSNPSRRGASPKTMPRA